MESRIGEKKALQSVKVKLNEMKRIATQKKKSNNNSQTSWNMAAIGIGDRPFA